MKPRQYIVVLGDLIGSRKIKQRNKASNNIRKSIEDANIEFKNQLIAPFLQTQGMDTISGVLFDPSYSFQVCHFINHKINPLKYRFSIARGEIDIGIKTKNASLMDGPAFHKATELMENAKKNKLVYNFYLHILFDEFDQWLNLTTNLLNIIQEDWTKHQLKIFHMYRKLNDQRSVAKALGISQQAVSNALIKTHWKLYQQTEELIINTLTKYSTKNL